MQWLKDNYSLWQTYKQSGTVRIDYNSRAMLYAIAKEIDSRYYVDINCPNCVPDLLRFVYSKYDECQHT